MADDRYGYGRREGWQSREGSIFSDDDDRWRRGSDRWSSDYGRERGRGGRDDDRGFFERAGDEVRSWLGDNEAEQRRERDARRDEAREAFGGRDFDSRYEGGGRGAFGSRSRSESGLGSFDREQGYGQRSFGGGRSGLGGGERSFGGGRSQWDDNYRRWRDRQVEQFDREYEDYCRERQHQFEQDFDSWRSSRLTEGGTAGQFGGSSSGEALQGYGGSAAGSRAEAAAGGRSGTLGTGSAGAVTTGAGTGSAAESSTGSSGGGRGGRSRS